MLSPRSKGHFSQLEKLYFFFFFYYRLLCFISLINNYWKCCHFFHLTEIIKTWCMTSVSEDRWCNTSHFTNLPARTESKSMAWHWESWSLQPANRCRHVFSKTKRLHAGIALYLGSWLQKSSFQNKHLHRNIWSTLVLFKKQKDQSFLLKQR